ncbi:MAG: hypothetical protein Q7U20_04645 [Caulobacter sp.]|nr:hypothetical protein [Caulobacter sp.]
MSRPLLIASALTLLAACGSAPQAMPAKPPKPESPPVPPVALLVAPGAIGPATTTTPFDLSALRRLFPGSDVRAGTVSEEGVDMPVLFVRGPGDITIEFHGGDDGTLDRAFVTGAAPRGLRGEAIGLRLSASGLPRGGCIAGADRLGDAIICRRPDAPQLGLVFAPADAVDPVLREFYWTADS